jgi:hypothetical protein
MLYHWRKLVWGLALAVLGLPASAQEAKKDAKKDNAMAAMDRALDQSKLTGAPILAVAGSET